MAAGRWFRLSPLPWWLRRRARAARREARFADAATLYEEVARLRPEDAALRIQCGHMRKEAGQLAAAEAHYRAALARLPDDAGLAVQLGHLRKARGDSIGAAVEYRRAALLDPHAPDPPRELAALRQAGRLDPPVATGGGGARAEAAIPAGSFDLALLAPDLAPDVATLPTRPAEGFHFHRLGRRAPTRWGIRPVLRGVEAVHGRCVVRGAVAAVQLLFDGATVLRAAPAGPFAVEDAPDAPAKWVFNLWLDLSAYTPGEYRLEVRLVGPGGATVCAHHDTVAILPPLDPADHPWSDGIVPVIEPDAALLPAAVRVLPSVVRPARRRLFPAGVARILVLRTDQLGDMVASIPAMRRLRALFPAARITGLLTAANADLARSLGLFDAVEVIDFPDDPVARRRLMPLAEQDALRRRLAAQRFDIALDLAPSDVSRDLLHLSGARFTHGVGGGDRPWLTSEVVANTRDAWSGMDVVPHSAKALAIVETLGAALQAGAPLIRRDDPAPGLLAPFGLTPGAPFFLLHAGARIAFSRWPHYGALAEVLLARFAWPVLLLTEEPDYRERLSPALLADPRFRLIDRRLPFDQFDALIAAATVVVGNDSGPKHLAALRGTPVVTLFTARINWAEWAQEEVGTVISRRVPCQGCALFHDAEECGQGFTCIADIRVAEVVAAVTALVPPDA